MKVLLVEDQAHQRELVARVLLKLGDLEVVSAENGKEAMGHLYETSDFDVVVTDLHMPEMDGIELLGNLKNLEMVPRVIIMSAEDTAILGAAASVAHAHALEILGVVEKPVTRSKIGPMIERARSSAKSVTIESVSDNSILSKEQINKMIDAGALRVMVQPKVAIADRRLVGGEALSRLLGQDGELITPSAFIQTVEGDPDLALRLTEDVTRIVASLLAEWPSKSVAAPLSVNLPAGCLSIHGVADRLCDIVLGLGASPEQICWEVTETAIITNPAAALETLTRLRLKRFSLSIDDYGTGHSSLDRLMSVPFNEVKLDKVFVTGCVQNVRAQKVIASTAALAHDLGLRSVAEGAETDEEVEMLGDLGIEVVQGYAVSKPLAINDFLQFSANGANR